MTAIENLTSLISLRTAEIREAEAKSEWDGATLKALYGNRLMLIVEAMQAGATASYLSEITGNR